MRPTSPPLVIVGGAPAAGKSTLAVWLAGELRLPLLTKDAIKEILGDTLGAADRPRSKVLGAASYTLLYAMAGWLLDAGVGMILESNFWRGASEPELWSLASRARPVLVHCEAPPDVILRRYAVRGARHPVHFDREELPALESALAAGRFEPLALPTPAIRVNTENGYRPARDDVLSFIHRHITA